MSFWCCQISLGAGPGNGRSYFIRFLPSASLIFIALLLGSAFILSEFNEVDMYTIHMFFVLGVKDFLTLVSKLKFHQFLPSLCLIWFFINSIYCCTEIIIWESQKQFAQFQIKMQGLFSIRMPFALYNVFQENNPLL